MLGLFLPAQSGCQGQTIDQVAITKSLPRRDGFTPLPNPIIQAGDMMSKGLWNDACVLKIGSQYVMYLTSSPTSNPFKPPILPFRAVSSDGIKWALQPTTSLLRVTGNEFVSYETPCVVYFKGKYHMYYSAIAKPGTMPMMAIGHAVSNDGITWTNDAQPVLRAGKNLGEWNGLLVAEPGAVVYNDQVYLFYSTIGPRPGGNPPQLQVIALATSSDGKTFGPQRQVLGQAPVYPASAGFCGYSTPAPLVHNGRIHLFFDVAHFQKGRDAEWQQVALHHAVSNDGGNTFVQDAAPFMTRDQFVWSAGEMLAPWAIVDGNKVKLWFTGHTQIKDFAPMIHRGIKGPEFGIGYATADLSWLDSP